MDHHSVNIGVIIRQQEVKSGTPYGIKKNLLFPHSDLMVISSFLLQGIKERVRVLEREVQVLKQEVKEWETATLQWEVFTRIAQGTLTNACIQSF